MFSDSESIVKINKIVEYNNPITKEGFGGWGMIFTNIFNFFVTSFLVTPLKNLGFVIQQEGLYFLYSLQFVYISEGGWEC